jgi:hypothetical protein
MIEEAKDWYGEYKFKLIDMTNIDELEKKFDFIFFIASFHHLYEQDERYDVLKKTRRLLEND